jgi:hypothetical protein
MIPNFDSRKSKPLKKFILSGWPAVNPTFDLYCRIMAQLLATAAQKLSLGGDAGSKTLFY